MGGVSLSQSSIVVSREYLLKHTAPSCGLQNERPTSNIERPTSNKKIRIPIVDKVKV